jgi:hypothetical protein
MFSAVLFYDRLAWLYDGVDWFTANVTGISRRE